MSPVPGQNPLNPPASTELLAPEFLPPESMPAPVLDASGHDSLAPYLSQTVLQAFPNDLNRNILLASLLEWNG